MEDRQRLADSLRLFHGASCEQHRGGVATEVAEPSRDVVFGVNRDLMGAEAQPMSAPPSPCAGRSGVPSRADTTTRSGTLIWLNLNMV